jgi:peptidoglycan/LPS O-acetylase OafA/YrhL
VPHLTGGFVGVDVFFVISGYLITALLANEIDRTGTISVSAFVARRIRRLFPAAFVVLLVTLALAALVQPPLQVVRTAASARDAFAYAANIHFYQLASDYFSGDVRSNPTLHMWSLSVEEQFYLAWPWLVLAFGRQSGGPGLARRRLSWALTAIALVSFLAACSYTGENRSLAFYGTPFRAWEFGAGGLTWLFQGLFEGRGRPLARPWEASVAWTGFGLVLAAAVLFSPLTDFPGASALLPVAGASMLLLAGGRREAPAGAEVDRLLRAVPMQWIGKRSYGWYLWHWPLLALGASVLPRSGFGFRCGLALIALVLADLSYRVVERPIRMGSGQSSPKSAPVRRTIRVGLAATAVMIVAAELARRAAIVASNSPTQRAYTAAASDIAAPYRDGCVTEVRDDLVHPCVYGAASSRTTVALFGDSHAVQWFPALDSIARTRGWGLLVLAKTRCATADVPVYEVVTRQRSWACDRWRRAAIDTIQRRRVALVLLSNAIAYVRTPRLAPAVPAVSVAAWETGLTKTLSELHSRAIPTVIIRDTPYLDANVPLCLSRSGWLGHISASCATARDRALNATVAETERRVAAAFPAVQSIDLSDQLCTSATCPPVVDGVIAYSDNEHLTATMVRALTASLADALALVGSANK